MKSLASCLASACLLAVPLAAPLRVPEIRPVCPRVACHLPFAHSSLLLGAPSLGGKKGDRTKSPLPMIDINRASAEDFQKLPGIGLELARRMVAYRQRHGPFRRVEELLAIRGIGSKKWRAIKPYLFVGGTARKTRGRE
jgi:competence ComEA-like helix-hairpin-helix protein